MPAAQFLGHEVDDELIGPGGEAALTAEGVQLVQDFQGCIISLYPPAGDGHYGCVYGMVGISDHDGLVGGRVGEMALKCLLMMRLVGLVMVGLPAMPHTGSRELLNVPPTVTNVTAYQALGSGVVQITYDVYDPEQNIVTISFQYWMGSGWAEALTTTGEGQVPIGTNRTGTWTARADAPWLYMTDARIRVTADDGQGGIGTGQSPTFLLDTAPPFGCGCGFPPDGAAGIPIDTPLIAGPASDPSQPVEYAFDLYAVSPPGGTQSSGWITSTLWTPNPLDYSTTYSWRVGARDAYGNLSWAPYSFSFTTVDPPPGYMTPTPQLTSTHTPIPSVTPPPPPPPLPVTVTDEPTSTPVPPATATDTPTPTDTATSTPLPTQPPTKTPTAIGTAMTPATSLPLAAPTDTALPVGAHSRVPVHRPTVTPSPPSVALTAVPTVTETPLLARTAIVRVVSPPIRHLTARITPAGVATRSAPVSPPTAPVGEAGDGAMWGRLWLMLSLAALAGLAAAVGIRRARHGGR